MIEKYSFGQDVPPSIHNNVIDLYKSWEADEIRADLQPRRNDMISVCQNLSHDFNKAVVVRSNNAFLGKAVYIVGRRRYDRRGTVGTYHYENVYHADSMREVIDLLHSNNYTVFGIDNNVTTNKIPKQLGTFEIPRLSAFVYGEETTGLSDDTINLCDDLVYIRQQGSVRSLNVSCAATCCMYEYTRQWASNTAPNKFVR